jgi:hypothetical protein
MGENLNISMESFELFLEKTSNPLRKAELAKQGTINHKQYALELKKNIQNGVYDKNDANQVKIFNGYQSLKKNFPERAEAFLDQEISNYFRAKLPESIKIYDYQGVQVFVDNLADQNSFKEGSYLNKMAKFSVQVLIRETKDLMPNRKPKIIITDKHKNPHFKSTVVDAAAIYRDRLIYIDQYEIEKPELLIHEFAHFVADLIPKQTEAMLDEAFKKVLDSYWHHVKKKRQPTQPQNPDDKEEVKNAQVIRQKISKKLGFPEYGLMNRDEFFAVLIENWKKLPNNTLTYRYKQLVKNVLTRL